MAGELTSAVPGRKANLWRFLRAGLAAAVVFTVGLTMTAQPSAAADRTWTKMEVTTQLSPRAASAAKQRTGKPAGAINPNLNGPSTAHLDPQLRADLADQMWHPQTYDTGPAQRTIAGPHEDWMTLNQCRTGWAAITESWFYRNHFSGCQINMNTAAFYRCLGTKCEESGRASVAVAFPRRKM